MPNRGERPSYFAISRILENPKVQEFLKECTRQDPQNLQASATDGVTEVYLGDARNHGLPKFVVAIDGSCQAVPAANGFPGAEVGFVTAAVVLLDLERVRALQGEKFPAPIDVRRTSTTETGSFVLPGCNILHKDDIDPRHSFRRRLWEELAGVRLARDGESLLDTYHALLAYKSGSREVACPYDDCQAPDRTLGRGQGVYRCACPLARPLYATDQLRIHEAFNPSGPSTQAYTETMQVIERLLLVNFLRTLEKRGLLDTLGQIALFIDGPLAVFGHPAWLKDAIVKELQRINGVVRRTTGKDLLLVGIEKTGAFMEHFLRLDTHETGSPGRFPPGTALLLTDRYIKEHIILSNSERPYGYQTYFGRKFFYKTRFGARIVAMTPFLNARDSDLMEARPDQYPRLKDATALLDTLVSARYPDALIPIVEAHAQATIARGLGAEVLNRLVEELIRRAD